MSLCYPVLPMRPDSNTRRSELVGDTLRRFARRRSRPRISKVLAKMRPEDVAAQFGDMMPAEQIEVYSVLLADFPQSAGQVLVEIEDPARQNLLEELTPQQIAGILERMSVDDAVRVVESLPPELEEKVLEIVDVRDLAEVQEHLSYEDDSAGRLMDTALFAILKDATVEEARDRLQNSEGLDNILYVYVVDESHHLVGVLSLRHLLLSKPNRTLEEVMTRSVIKVHTGTDQEEVAKLVARYDLLALPVTDDSNHLVGIVTFDDIIDVVKEEATEDFFKMVGTSDGELVYQEQSVKVARIRLPWLLVNLIGLILAGMLIKAFEVTLQQALFLVFFLPVVMGMGGNMGSQSATITVRGLATGRISSSPGRMRHFLWQQVKVGAILASSCSLLTVLLTFFFEGSSPGFALVIGVSLFLAITLASLNGSLIPILFERWNIDPAVAAGPLVTTLNDITGILIYFSLASLMIDYLL